MGKQDIIERIPQQHTAPAVVTPMDMINAAVVNGASIETLEKLMGLSERWEANQARKAFDAAMAEAKANMGTVQKTTKGNYGLYADFASVARLVDPVLSEHGLSYRFNVDQTETRMKVVCIVRHRDGHFEETTLMSPIDTSGSKNAVQQIGSTQTYLMRYTLMAALGLAASRDDDGHSSNIKSAPVAQFAPPYAEDEEFLSAKQVEALRRALDVVGRDEARFCKYLGVARLEDIYADKFQACLEKIEGAAR